MGLRKKELKLVVTFHTTADAMEMEKICKKQGIKGKLIPIPRALSAGCGLAWKSCVEDKQNIENVLKDNKNFEEKLYLLEL